MDYVSIIGDLLHVVVAAPLLGVGIVIGVVGYRIMLKNEPALLNGLVSTAYSDLQAALKTLEAKAGAAVKPAPAPTPEPATVAAPATATPVADTTAPAQAADASK